MNIQRKIEEREEKENSWVQGRNEEYSRTEKEFGNVPLTTRR
jgi:hypothetical protein